MVIKRLFFVKRSKICTRCGQEKEVLKNQLNAADSKIAELERKARDWQRAADGLARMIEEIKAKEGVDNV